MRDKINADLKEAMKAGEKDRVGTLRLINAAIKSADIEARPSGKDKITDADILSVLAKMVKQRRDSIAQYRDAGREELAAKEEAELEILQHYLPEALGEAELDKLIEEAISASGAESMKDMGKVMGQLKPKVQGRADMGAVSARIKARLSS